MAINYTWDVKTVDVKEIDGNADTVFNVHWRLNAEDDANTVKDMQGNDIPATASVYGTQSLDTSDLSDFTAFSEIGNGIPQDFSLNKTLCKFHCRTLCTNTEIKQKSGKSKHS